MPAKMETPEHSPTWCPDNSPLSWRLLPTTNESQPYQPTAPWQYATFQPSFPHSTRTTKLFRPLRNLHITHHLRISLPDHHTPEVFVDHLREVNRSLHPEDDAATMAATAMTLVTKMERSLRRRIAFGLNRIGACTDHMKQLDHDDPPTRPCDCCGREVTQRWKVQPSSDSPLNPGSTFHNTAAAHTLHTAMLTHLCSLEPAIRSTSLDHYTDYETAVRHHLQATLTPAICTWLCYTCAKPAMRFSRHRTLEQPTPPRDIDTADYRAIFQGRPTGLHPEPPDAPTEPSPGGPTPTDPWVRRLWRGQRTLDLSDQTVGVIVTIAPSRQTPPDPTASRSIVAFIRACGQNTPATDPSRLASPTDIDDTTLCIERPIDQLHAWTHSFLTTSTNPHWKRITTLTPWDEEDTGALDPPNTPTTRPPPASTQEQQQLNKRRRQAEADLAELARQAPPPPLPPPKDQQPATKPPPLRTASPGKTPAEQPLPTTIAATTTTSAKAKRPAADPRNTAEPPKMKKMKKKRYRSNQQQRLDRRSKDSNSNPETLPGKERAQTPK